MEGAGSFHGHYACVFIQPPSSQNDSPRWRRQRRIFRWRNCRLPPLLVKGRSARPSAALPNEDEATDGRAAGHHAFPKVESFFTYLAGV